MAKRQRGIVEQPQDNEETEVIEKEVKPKATTLPLHTKLRPDTFNAFLGNTSTVNSIKSKLAQGALHHSILLQGPSGCGKTTIARILKSELKCSDFDFVEINMGNIGGVATAREIIRNVKLRPMQGDCRIYLLDECQQATKDFQNALLKPLEDTPSYAYFILCTTDPQKLLLTIRNRCAIYEVNKLSDDDVAQLIERTAERENKSVDDEVVTDIMIASEGCPRQAMVILDQIIDLDPRRQRRAIKNFIGQEAATLGESPEHFKRPQ
jgi:DNA polymerase-3 subunit gamma/tau